MDKKKRYQIFVSSTFADLEEERGKVMETILNFNCFPAGMELFPAMDEEIFKYIMRIIDESDYYLLIIGGRYGSMDESNVSWTEREFDYAMSKGIPIIAFDHNDFTKLPANKTDLDDKKRKKLVAFKEKASKGRLIKKWTDSKDLALAVATSLKSVLDLQPRIGWVRADSIPSGDVQKEIDRLKKEIEIHQAEVKGLKEDLKKKDADLEKKDKDYQDLELKYQTAQLEIEKLNERIRSLETELDKCKVFKPVLEKESQPQTEVFTVKGVSFKMVHVEGGTFMMGADKGDKDAYSDENPAHEVTLSDYWMGETQVTQALWQAVMGENPSRFKGVNHPVERVSWDDCQVFIIELNRLTGKKFCLPTEAKWEFAARGGNRSMGYKYSGSNNANKVAWYDENSMGKTHPVGEKSPNELGLYDMSGNVWEWCSDRFDGGYYNDSPTDDPTGSSNGTDRVRRGAGWGSSARSCRVTRRYSRGQSEASFTLGLRLAL